MNLNEIQKKVNDITESISILTSTINIELDLPESLSQKGLKVLNKIEELISLYYEIIKLGKDKRDEFKMQESLFKIEKQMELSKDSKYKVSEAELEKYANANESLYKQKLEINEIEAEEILIEQTIQNMRELINILKKGVESKKNIESDYNKFSM